MTLPVNSALRTVVVVAGQAFPPIVSANLHRVLAWARYLPQFGWKPIILTLPVNYRSPQDADSSLLRAIPEGTEVRRIPPLLLKRAPARSSSPPGRQEKRRVSRSIRRAALGAARNVKNQLILPDARLTWVPVALRDVRRIWKAQPFDALLTTSRENSNHLVGWRASVFPGMPWVADLQDPWQSSWDVGSGTTRWLNRQLGRHVLRAATHFTVMSPSIGHALSEKYGAPRGRITVITNGFSPRQRDSLEPRSPHSDRVIITHTGRFYGRRSPRPLLAAAERLANAHPGVAQRLEIRLVGDFDVQVMKEISRYRSAPWLKLIPPVPHEEALRHQDEADLLLLITGEDWNALPGKIFEYLAIGKPLLAVCAAESDTARLVHELAAGAVLDPGDPDGIDVFLLDLLSGRVKLTLPSDFSRRVQRFTWKSVVGGMAAVLDDVTSRHARAYPA